MIKAGLVTCLLLIILVGLGGTPSGTGAMNVLVPLEAVIRENAAALAAQDAERYLATLHPESPAYPVTPGQLDMLARRGDLTCEIVSLLVIEQAGDRAQVRVVQITRWVNGPPPRDNQITVVHELRPSPDGGTWLLYRSTVEDVLYLN